MKADMGLYDMLNNIESSFGANKFVMIQLQLTLPKDAYCKSHQIFCISIQNNKHPNYEDFT